MRKQIESLDSYFGTISLAWLQEESDYRKVRGEKGNKKITIERFFIGTNSAQIHFTVAARGLWNLGWNELPSCPF